MSITIVNDIFTQDEIERLNQTIKAVEPIRNDELGRLLFNDVRTGLNMETTNKLDAIVKGLTDLPLQISSAAYVEYNNLYGKPNLPPHLDGDSSDLLINIQIESNTNWAIGLNFETYTLKDNSALIFNQNKEIHWRVHKDFKDGEYVRMLFIRLHNTENLSDYSHYDLRQNDEMFRETVEFRESLGIF